MRCDDRSFAFPSIKSRGYEESTKGYEGCGEKRVRGSGCVAKGTQRVSAGNAKGMANGFRDFCDISGVLSRYGRLYTASTN